MGADHDRNAGSERDRNRDPDPNRDRDRGRTPAGTERGIDRRRFRTVGAVHLGLAAAVNLVAGLALVYLGATSRLVRWAFVELDTYLTAETLVRDATTVAAVARPGAVLVGAALVVSAVAAALVALGTARDRRPGRWLPTAAVAALNPLATPLALIAAALLWLGRSRGRGQGA